jgi:hypothetical protein
MKKLKVEFYFILYIGALVSMLVIAQEKDKTNEKLKQTIGQLEKSNVILDSLLQNRNSNVNFNVKNKITFISLEGEQYFDIGVVGDIKKSNIRYIKSEKLDNDFKRIKDFKNYIDTVDNKIIRFRWAPNAGDVGIYKLNFRAESTPSITEKFSEDYKTLFGKKPIVSSSVIATEVILEVKNNSVKLPPVKIY